MSEAKQTKAEAKEYVMVTGATGSIGAEIALALAREGKALVLPARNPAKLEAVMNRLREQMPDVEMIPMKMDLASEQSVGKCVEMVKAKGLNVTSLINNAGLMLRRYAADSRGRDLTTTVNYHNTVLLTTLMLRACPGLRRIVFTTSITRIFFKHPDPEAVVDKKHFHQLRTYGRSKALITDYARRLHQGLEEEWRGRELEVNCADPGVVNTNMISMQRWYDPFADVCVRPLMRSPRQGAQPALRAWADKRSGLIFCRHAVHRL